jgi:hypothetical protein
MSEIEQLRLRAEKLATIATHLSIHFRGEEERLLAVEAHLLASKAVRAWESARRLSEEKEDLRIWD